MVKSAPQATFFKTQDTFLLKCKFLHKFLWLKERRRQNFETQKLKGPVFSKFKISTFSGQKRAAGEIFETQNACFLKWKVLTQFNISIFSGKKKAAGEIFETQNACFLKWQFLLIQHKHL